MTLTMNLRKKRSVFQKLIPTMQAYLCISVSKSVILNVSKSGYLLMCLEYFSVESNIKICQYFTMYRFVIILNEL